MRSTTVLRSKNLTESRRKQVYFNWITFVKIKSNDRFVIITSESLTHTVTEVRKDYDNGILGEHTWRNVSSAHYKMFMTDPLPQNLSSK